MFNFNVSDIYVIIAIYLPNVIIMYLINYIVSNIKNIKQDYKNYLVGSSLIFYISFSFIFIYWNLFIGILLFWLLLLITTVFLRIQTKKRLFKKIHFKDVNFKVILALILISSILFATYYDALTHISHNFPDTYYNYIWIKSNLQNLGNAFYFPGLSILAAQQVVLFDPLFNLNLFAASFSILILIGINLILKSVLSNKSLILFNIILISPFYQPLLFMRTSLNNSFLFSLIFFALVVFICVYSKIKVKYRLIYFTFLSVASFITAPHILFLTLPGILLAYILSNKIKVKIINYFTILIIGALFFASKFSSPESIYLSGNKSNLQNFYDRLFFLLFDWLKIKFPIRSPLESMNSLFVYLIMLLSVIFIVYAKKHKNNILLFFSILTIAYGISVQTGIGEFSMLKGRIGWYFMYTVAILLSIVFDEFINKNYFRKQDFISIFVLILVIINFISLMLKPPKAYRVVDEKVLFSIQKMIENDYRNRLNVFSDIEDVRFVSEKINFIETRKFDFKKIDYIILNFNNDEPDLILANLRRYEDRDFENFFKRQNEVIAKRIELNNELISQAINKGLTIIVKNDDYVMLKNIHKQIS
jgi:hypothetical protein